MNLNTNLKVSLVHIGIGALIGIISAFITNNWIAIALAIVVLYATGQATQRLFKLTEDKEKYNFKWWLSSGVYPYIIFWFLLWVIFYNRDIIFKPIGG